METDSNYASELRPKTQALDALIRETVSRLNSHADGQPSHAMLFTGNWHQAFPALLVQDPVLEPVDKVVWMVIRLHARETGAQALFPSQQDIARKANIKSTSTVVRAIAILRITRWLSLCARVRDEGGRFRGNVYALHDEPLPLGDAIHLDGGYMRLLNDSVEHQHSRVKAVGRGALASINGDIEDGRDVCVQENPMERRLRAAKALARAKIGRYFSFNSDEIASLHRSNDNREHQDQNLVAASCSSSSKKNIKTTTTRNPRNSASVGKSSRLIYPERLNASQRDLVNRYLAAIPEDRRQPVLDELEGRIRSEKQGAPAVYDEPRYVARLCRAVKAGSFVPNLGAKVREQRERRRQAAQQMRAKLEGVPGSENKRRKRPSPEAVAAHLADIRKALGIETAADAN